MFDLDISRLHSNLLNPNHQKNFVLLWLRDLLALFLTLFEWETNKLKQWQFWFSLLHLILVFPSSSEIMLIYYNKCMVIEIILSEKHNKFVKLFPSYHLKNTTLHYFSFPTARCPINVLLAKKTKKKKRAIYTLYVHFLRFGGVWYVHGDFQKKRLDLMTSWFIKLGKLVLELWFQWYLGCMANLMFVMV